jgi:hypothetical protein
VHNETLSVAANARQQCRLFVPRNQRLRPSPSSNRLCGWASRFNCCSPGITSDSILRSKKERERVSDSPAMISVPRLCPKCGSEIPADAPEKGCPGCLLENGLGLLPDPRVAAGAASTVTMTKADQCGSAENFGARMLRLLLTTAKKQRGPPRHWGNSATTHYWK